MEIYPKKLKCPICQELLNLLYGGEKENKKFILGYKCISDCNTFFSVSNEYDPISKKEILYIIDVNTSKKYKVNEISPEE